MGEANVKIKIAIEFSRNPAILVILHGIMARAEKKDQILLWT